MKIPCKYLILTVLSCILTLVTQLISHITTSVGDAAVYIHLAKQYSTFNFFEPSNFNNYGHTGYVIFLIIIGNIFTYNEFIVGIIQTILFCISAFLLISELEKYLNKNLTGLAIILILVPEIHFFNGTMETETVAYSIMLLTFMIALRIYRYGATPSKLILLSFLLGFNIITRSECIVCIFAALYLIFPRIKERLFLYSLIILSFPVFLLFLTGVKNYETFHRYRINTFGAEEGFYSGNNENLDGSYHHYLLHKKIFFDSNRIIEVNKIIAEPLIYSIPKLDSLYHQLAIEAWEKSPSQQLGVIPEKFVKDWFLPGMIDIYTVDTSKQRGLQLEKLLSKKYSNNIWYAQYKHLIHIVIHWLVLLLIVWGLFSIKKQNRFQIAILLLWILYLACTIPFYGLPIIHVTIFPLLIITFMPLPLVGYINRLVKADI